MTKKRVSLSDEIRQAVDASEMSRYRICKLLGIAESVLSRFMSGNAGLSLETLDRLAKLLNLHLVVDKGQKKERVDHARFQDDVQGQERANT